jgi:hypothetical protein
MFILVSNLLYLQRPLHDMFTENEYEDKSNHACIVCVIDSWKRSMRKTAIMHGKCKRQLETDYEEKSNHARYML